MMPSTPINAGSWLKERRTTSPERRSKPEYRTIAGVVIEGIEDLAEIADGVA